MKKLLLILVVFMLCGCQEKETDVSSSENALALYCVVVNNNMENFVAQWRIDKPIAEEGLAQEPVKNINAFAGCDAFRLENKDMIYPVLHVDGFPLRYVEVKNDGFIFTFYEGDVSSWDQTKVPYFKVVLQENGDWEERLQYLQEDEKGEFLSDGTFYCDDSYAMRDGTVMIKQCWEFPHDGGTVTIIYQRQGGTRREQNPREIVSWESILITE